MSGAPPRAAAGTPARDTLGAPRLTVGLAAAGVLVGAADTYVIVLALPAIMADVGISLDQLQQATPIISGFLTGYVVLMPLLGRLSDLYGRTRLLVVCLALFAAGSLVSASAHDLTSVVAGRALQGLGGGGLVPVTLALVADQWPAERRSVPLGVVGGVQEFGSVIGPLYGALILSVSTWRAIFWLYIPIALLLGSALVIASRRRDTPRAARSRADVPGAVLAAGAVIAGGLAVAAPDVLRNGAGTGTLYAPLVLPWLSPLLLAAVVCGLGFVAWEARPAGGGPRIVDVRRAAQVARDADWVGAVLIAAVLGAVIVAFATSDPAQSPIAPAAVWLLPAAAVCAGLFALRLRSARAPLLDLAALRAPGSAGALAVNLAAGAALMAALVDIPILARTTVFRDSQLGAALVLLRLLLGVPAGALLGGWLALRLGNRAVAAAGLALSAGMFALMGTWTTTTLSDPLGTGWLHPSDPVLVLCGAGFGLAIAPVNASMLAAVRATAHGVASALVVVARMVGMLAGISVLTAVGLRAFHIAASQLPTPITLCPHTPLSCNAYDTLVTGAIVTELRTVFDGAGICAAIAALAAMLLLRDGRARRVPAAAHG
ncbi:MAG: MFS transporter [Candidatus Dormibacteraeota bacterium]|nr:MFS transporter [Candidatus Dormibacteraeota bacterium]MBV9525786.1 MFS transporter [Candidatus Dormibacteraeota bacterium]